jgi:hypothetical protein
MVAPPGSVHVQLIACSKAVQLGEIGAVGWAEAERKRPEKKENTKAVKAGLKPREAMAALNNIGYNYKKQGHIALLYRNLPCKS